jgi:hypothetical protein
MLLKTVFVLYAQSTDSSIEFDQYIEIIERDDEPKNRQEIRIGIAGGAPSTLALARGEGRAGWQSLLVRD